MDAIDRLVEEVIPVYTVKRPNPATGKEDCRLVRIHKEGKRTMMRQRIQELVDRYREKPDSEKEEQIGPQAKHEMP